MKYIDIQIYTIMLTPLLSVTSIPLTRIALTRTQQHLTKHLSAKDHSNIRVPRSQYANTTHSKTIVGFMHAVSKNYQWVHLWKDAI